MAMIGMPLIAAMAKNQDRAEAHVFIAGSVGSGLITLGAFRVMLVAGKCLRKQADVLSPQVAVPSFSAKDQA